MAKQKDAGKPSDPVCAYCSKPGPLHRDHVVPRSRGGPDTAQNIVMACAACNGSKGDQLASEWLGERCPAPVLLIEARVNAKLKTAFRARDKKAPPILFAYSVTEAGRVEYIGEVASETERSVRIRTVNAFSLYAGVWDLYGELKDIPRERCRLFEDRDVMLAAVDQHEARE